MSRILVVGANGTVGTELIGNLKAKGHQPMGASSRKNLAAGQVSLDLATGEGRERAFAGVDKAFLLSPPPLAKQDEVLIPLIEEARRNKLQKVVLMTAMNANLSDTPFKRAEAALEKSGLAYNIIRPNWFMQNFNSFWIKGILEANTVFLPVGQAKTSFIDARDIAAGAAELLDTDRFDNRDFDLTGGEALTHEEAAALIAKATARPVRFQDISPEEMRAGLLQAGVPEDYTALLIAILGYLKQGASERRTDAVETILGRPPIRFEQYARDYRQAWV